ncbi:hypothetical protein M8Z33_27590 [Streptomyces sp. ZAF1911]|uniref:hypothetical protein n=1 Tax=Streptomyces sp. ZAF1911 TaxID=2944129 RepID=UPI00237C51DB|nr:hypothetical protein [Streptomyces sp. ZAF1911]MDD9380351.1 hypothetical protein [Streptomyces sp. ZAF1911]
MPPTDRRPDFCLDGFEPANKGVGEAFWNHLDAESESMTTLAAHHSPDGRNSFYVIHNGAVTWGTPGDPQLIAAHIKRDSTTKTFDFEHAELPLPAMAQSWLIKRGCPADAIALPPGMGTTPADTATVALQQRLMRDGDHFALLESYTDDTLSQTETVVLLEALGERVHKPFRVLLEQADLDSFTHTLREGAFETLEAAVDWMEDRSTPLPAPAPSTARTAGPSALPSAPPRTPGRTR